MRGTTSLSAERSASLPPAPEPRAVAVAGDPFGQLLDFRVAVAKVRGEVREISEDQASLMSGQHGSLRGREALRREAIAAVCQIRSYRLCGDREPAIRLRIPARPARDDGFTWTDREVETLAGSYSDPVLAPGSVFL